MKHILKKFVTCSCAVLLLVAAVAACLPASAAADTAFDEKNIAVSFGVMTDLHLKDAAAEEKYNRAAEVTEQFAGRVPDAILFAGDYSYEGRKDEAEMFLNQTKRLYDPQKTALVVAYGNHDTYWSGSMKADGWYEVIKELFADKYQAADSQPQAGNQHVIVNGYHFLTVELKKYSPNVYDTATKEWLEETLDAIVEENPNQPIFVATHAAMRNTVYGSDMELEEGITEWGTSTDLNTVLQFYPQVVLFSGHSHYGNSLDRAIMQTDYTAVQVGSVIGIDVAYKQESNYVNASVSSLAATAQGLLVEVDKKGVTRITRIDYTRGAQIGEPWIIQKVNARKGTHLKDYTHDRAKTAAPVIDAKTLKVTPTDRGYAVNFAYPKTDATVYSYTYTIKRGGQTVRSFNVLSEWWNNPQGITTETYNFSEWDAEIAITPTDEWGNVGNTVTVKVADAEAQAKAWAAEVDGKIAAIGTVNQNSRAAIEAARGAYDALTDAVKALVTKLDVLEAAEKAFADLLSTATTNKPTTKPVTTTGPEGTSPTEPVTEQPDTVPVTEQPDTEPDTDETDPTGTTTTAPVQSSTPADGGADVPVGLIVGIAVGAVVVIAVVVLLLLLKKRKT